MKRSRQSPGEAEIGRRVRMQRLACGVTQQQLAGKLGVSFQQVQKYENGQNRISAGRLRQIAEILGASVSDFIPDNAKSEPAALRFASQHIDTVRAVRLFHAYGAMTSKEQIALVNLAEQIVAGRK